MPTTCAQCGARKSHPIHLRALALEGNHPFLDARKSGLKPMSEAKRAYLDSEEHRTVYDRAYEDTQCLAGLAGAPGLCIGSLVPHHIAGRGAFGGQAASERAYPVILLCEQHNSAIEGDVNMRRWAERNTFERDGREYPFRMTTRPSKRAEDI